MLPFKNIQSKMLPVSDPNAIWPTKILPPYPIYGDPSKKRKDCRQHNPTKAPL